MDYKLPRIEFKISIHLKYEQMSCGICCTGQNSGTTSALLGPLGEGQKSSWYDNYTESKSRTRLHGLYTT